MSRVIYQNISVNLNQTDIEQISNQLNKDSKFGQIVNLYFTEGENIGIYELVREFVLNGLQEEEDIQFSRFLASTFRRTKNRWVATAFENLEKYKNNPEDYVGKKT